MHHGSRKSGSKSARQHHRIIGLSAREEDRLKRELRLTTPSEPWIEAQFKTASDKETSGAKLTYRYRDPHVFPPGGPNTRMIRCAECGVFNPPNALEHGNCLDHAEHHQGWGRSPSALAIEALRKLNVELEEAPLEPEDSISLREEISNFKIKRGVRKKDAKR
jgi:hypothetical protein